MSNSESKNQKEIQRYLKSIGAYQFKTVVSNRRGIPDILCSYKGYFIAIEVKSETKGINGLSPLQKYELRKITESGALAMCANNVKYVKAIFSYYFNEVLINDTV